MGHHVPHEHITLNVTRLGGPVPPSRFVLLCRGSFQGRRSERHPDARRRIRRCFARPAGIPIAATTRTSRSSPLATAVTKRNFEQTAARYAPRGKRYIRCSNRYIAERLRRRIPRGIDEPPNGCAAHPHPGFTVSYATVFAGVRREAAESGGPPSDAVAPRDAGAGSRQSRVRMHGSGARPGCGELIPGASTTGSGSEPCS